MGDELSAPERPASVTRSEIAHGAGLAGLSRAGTAIDALSQPFYIWLFGLPTYGIYVVLWGGLNLLENLLDLSMTSALQRVVPMQERREDAHAAVKFALLVSVGLSVLAALAIALNAGHLATYLSAAPADQAQLPGAIALFAWGLPLWTFIEVSTSAARARRAFGPEIRIRVLWEQVARVSFTIGFFLLGFLSTGLIVAHLCSLAVTALLCVRLLARYYDLRLLVRVPIRAALARDLLATGIGLLPANLARRMLIDAPPVLLNLLIPGARGAAAAGLFEIGRKLSTVPSIVRQSFQYVLAPLSSHQASIDRAVIGTLYQFSSRVSTALVIPLAGFMIFAAPDLLSFYGRAAEPALPILVILSVSRAIEAIVGPATAIVEMIGHRLLPMLNSLLSLALWLALSLALAPQMGALGMAVAVAAATVVAALVAMIELGISDKVSPFDARLLQGLAVALVGVAAMALVGWLFNGAARFAILLAVWPVASWLALRFGLSREDREGLGAFAVRLRLA